MVTTFHASIPAAIPPIMVITMSPFCRKKFINSPTMFNTSLKISLICGRLLFTSSITSSATGANSSPSGCTTSVWILRPSASIWLLMSLYFWLLISASASFVLLISPCVCNKAVQASSPMSSYIVPMMPTPAVYCTVSSSQFFSASLICCIASFALSPPCWNFATTSSAFSPKLVKYSFAVPSFIRILNSLKASPSLSIDHVPCSAPDTSILNISSADSPAFAYCTEYSLITSHIS